MSEGKKYPLAQVKAIADEIVERLSLRCERIEIAGSLRRGRSMIGDIEIVALPLYNVTKNLFGEVTGRKSMVDLYLDSSPYGPLELNGPKMKKFRYHDLLNVDLFLPESANHWGCILTVRTGSADFNMWLMSVVQRRTKTYFQGGRLHRDGQWLDTPEEEDVFRELDLPFIPPDYRDDNRWLEIVG